MVHGLGANIAFWGLGIAPRLARMTRVTLYDLRGHGMSEMPRAGYTVPGMARDLDQLLEHLGIVRAHIVGHSFGGAIALEQALERPETVASLTLADPVVPMLADEDGAADLRERIAELNRPSAASEASAQDGFTPFVGAERSAQRWQQLLTRTDLMQELMSDGARPDRVTSLDRPVLLIYGARSRYRVLASAFAHWLPDCQRESVPGVGHFHPALRPRQFADRVAEFVSGIEAASAEADTDRHRGTLELGAGWG
jgi:pimeloyl-ACP methyl ester carboxylesterase